MSQAVAECHMRDGGHPGHEHPEGPGCPRNAPRAVSVPGRCFVLGSVCSGRAARSSAAPERNMKHVPDTLVRQEFLVIARLLLTFVILMHCTQSLA